MNDCEKCKYYHDNCDSKFRCRVDVEKIRADAIDEFCMDMLSKLEFEEKWLMKAKSDNADTNNAFGALKTFCKTRAEQLKEQK